MSSNYFKLIPADEYVIRQHLSSASVPNISFDSLLVYEWGQHSLSKDEITEQLKNLKPEFRRKTRTVALAMCLEKAHSTNYGKRFSEKEKEGYYFVNRIFSGYKGQNNESRAKDFYNTSFWASPVVMVKVLEIIDFWFSCPHNPYVDSYNKFIDEQVEEMFER